MQLDDGCTIGVTIMAKLTAKARNNLPKAKFALPAQRKYPIQDKAHAANAKARATQQVAAGHLAAAQAAMIKAKANRVLRDPGKLGQHKPDPGRMG